MTNEQTPPAASGADKKEPPAWAKVVGALVVFGGGWLAIDWYTASSMKNIENQVAADAVTQYEIAKRQGDAMQTCVQAGMVSAAFLQAKDEANYTKWKATERADCARAGLALP